MQRDHPNMQLLQTQGSFIGYRDANRYKFLKCIGQGTYGIVFLAVDTHTNEKVAIKKLQDVFRDVPRAVQFLREIKLLRLLRHPNIVEIKGILVPPSSDTFNDVFVVCELMDLDLRKAIRLNYDMTPKQQRYFMYQILCALKFMHAANVYHLDLKPDNVLVNEDNCLIKVCDLGLSRVAFSEPSTVWRYTGYVVTRAYRAPEICGTYSSKYPYAVDIWSIGCIFAEILTRKQLFPGTSYTNQLKLITDLLGTPSADTISRMHEDVGRKYLRTMKIKSPVPFAEKFPDLDPLALQLLQKLLTFDPKDRPTAEEALADNYFRVLPKNKSKPSQSITRDEFAFESCNSVMEIRALMYHEILQHHPQLFKDDLSQEPVCYDPIYYDPAYGYSYDHTMLLVHGGTSWLVNPPSRQDIFLPQPTTGEAYDERRVTNAIPGIVLSTQWPSLREATASLPLHLPYAYSSRNVTGEFIQNQVPLQRPLLPNESSSRNVTKGSVQNQVFPWPLVRSNDSRSSMQVNLEKSVTEEGRKVSESRGRNVTGESVQNQDSWPLFHSNASRPSMKVNQEKPVTEEGRKVSESRGRNVTGESVQNQDSWPLFHSNASRPSTKVNQEISLTEGRNVTESSGKNVTGESVQNQVPPRPLFPNNASRPSMKVNQEKSVTEEGNRESSLLRQLQDLNVKPYDRNKERQYSGSSSRNITRESIRNQVTAQPVFPGKALRTSMEVNQVNAVTEGNNREASLGQLPNLSSKPDDRNKDNQCSGIHDQ